MTDVYSINTEDVEELAEYEGFTIEWTPENLRIVRSAIADALGDDADDAIRYALETVAEAG
jgi:hypothetical protein